VQSAFPKTHPGRRALAIQLAALNHDISGVSIQDYALEGASTDAGRRDPSSVAIDCATRRRRLFRNNAKCARLRSFSDCAANIPGASATFPPAMFHYSRTICEERKEGEDPPTDGKPNAAAFAARSRFHRAQIFLRP
jgi:hypothetical protein